MTKRDARQDAKSAKAKGWAERIKKDRGLKEKGRLWYRVKLERDTNETILVSFRDFPEAHTFGDDEQEALAVAIWWRGRRLLRFRGRRSRLRLDDSRRSHLTRQQLEKFIELLNGDSGFVENLPERAGSQGFVSGTTTLA